MKRNYVRLIPRPWIIASLQVSVQSLFGCTDSTLVGFRMDWACSVGCSHQNLIFQKSFVPVFGAHASDVERAGGVVVADDIKEVHVVVRWKARVW